MRPFVSHPHSRPPWQRRLAAGFVSLFAWTGILALPAQALAHPVERKHPGVRTLSLGEMQRLLGKGGSGHNASIAGASGSTFSWEASAGGTNTANGNKLTQVPLVGWTALGGMGVAFTLAHNSQGNHNSEFGQKWTHSFDLYLVPSTGGAFGSTDLAVHWGDDLSYTFTQNVDGSYSAPVGIPETLVQNTDGTYTLTRADQTKYHYTTGYYCDLITDRNGNQIGISYNTGNYVTQITDPTGRTLVLAYDTSNRVTSVTDPLSRIWSFSYDTSNNLSTITYPVLGSTYYSETFGYNSAHDITSFQDKRGHTSTFTYNTDDSIASESDPYSNTTTYAYTTSDTTITDPNGHAVVYTYASGRNSQITDAASQSEGYVYDSSNNRTQTTDKRGYVWSATFDSRGNVLTSTDPYSNVTTNTVNSHNFLLTTTVPTGEETVITRDSHDNVTAVAQKDSGGTTQATTSFTVNSYGLVTDKYDANSHHYQYAFDTDGNLASVTTPNGHVTSGTYNALGKRTSITDAFSRTTTYTLDAWNQVTTVTYPDSSTKTFTHDAASNITQYVDATGTTTCAYDSDNRITTESVGGTTTASYTYDTTGKLGLLASVSDINSRTITYAYTSRNQLYSVADSAGTAYYTYDNSGAETAITNPNGTTVARVFDHAGRLTSVTNKNSGGTTLSSFSYTLDTDGRKSAVSELDGSTVSYGYDWGGRLTSETRTGTNAFSVSYTVDAVGNRTSQTIGSATTAFTLNSDDELTATSSSTGGFVNSYSYNANGEQTGRTLSGTAYTLAYDYDGQLLSISTGGSVQSSFAYDAAGRHVSRTSGSTTTKFCYAGGQILAEKQGSTTTAVYTYGNSLIRKDSETPLFDGSGHERTVTNGSQTVTGAINFDGFGNPVGSTGSSSSPYMYGATSGYRTEGDAGLSQVGARFYDAQVGRFITRDTYLNQSPYLYCDHDPVNATDPSGHQALRTPWQRFRDWALGKEEPDPKTEYVRPAEKPSGASDHLRPAEGPGTSDSSQLPRASSGPETGTGGSPGSSSGGSSGGSSGDDGGFHRNPGADKFWEGLAVVVVVVLVVGATCCFDADTPVMMADGSTKKIQDVHAGDWVLSWDEKTGKTVPKRVRRTPQTDAHNSLAVHFSDGEIIKTTENHLFYIPGKGFIPAREIAAQTICQWDGKCGKQVTEITWNYDVSTSHRVYNLEVDSTHTFFVGREGALVHDITPLAKQ